MDYPFNLKGILYFPRIRKDFGGQEGQIKLFNRQVFVADNIKEIIPEFLLLLRGVLDCPDLPLNVSRSFLQNDGYVRKLSAHITTELYREVARRRMVEGESYKEISEHLDMSLNTVRTRIRRAKQLMDKMRDKSEDEE